MISNSIIGSSSVTRDSSFLGTDAGAGYKIAATILTTTCEDAPLTKSARLCKVSCCLKQRVRSWLGPIPVPIRNPPQPNARALTPLPRAKTRVSAGLFGWFENRSPDGSLLGHRAETLRGEATQNKGFEPPRDHQGEVLRGPERPGIGGGTSWRRSTSGQRAGGLLPLAR